MPIYRSARVQARVDAVVAALRDLPPGTIVRVKELAHFAGIVHRGRYAGAGAEVEFPLYAETYNAAEYAVKDGLVEKLRGCDVAGEWASGAEIGYRYKGDPAVLDELEAIWGLPATEPKRS